MNDKWFIFHTQEGFEQNIQPTMHFFPDLKNPQTLTWSCFHGWNNNDTIVYGRQEIMEIYRYFPTYQQANLIVYYKSHFHADLDFTINKFWDIFNAFIMLDNIQIVTT